MYQDLAGGVGAREVVEMVEALPFSLSLADLSPTPTELPAQHLQAGYTSAASRVAYSAPSSPATMVATASV